MPDAARTCTALEAAVLEVLRDGPAALGPRTEVSELRPLKSQLGFPPPAGKETFGKPVPVRTVETRHARALQAAGWVLIDAGGTVTINPEGPAA